jgi:hypothetical protein
MSFIVSLAHVFQKTVGVRSTGLSLICLAKQIGSSDRINSAGMSVHMRVLPIPHAHVAQRA